MRWSGFIPLLLVVVGIAVGWTLFIDRIIRVTAEDALGDMLGTEVDIAGVNVQLRHASIAVTGFAVAEPSNPTRNVVQIGELVLDLDAAPLLRKKLVVDHAAIRDVRFNTARATPARPAAPTGYASQTLGSLREWARKVSVPPLQLLPVDTIKAIVLDPAQLASVQAALLLSKRVDSLRTWSQTAYDSLRVGPALDSAQKVATSLKGAKPTTLGVDGTRRAIADVQRTLGALTDAKKRVDGYAQGLQRGLDTLTANVRGLDAARQKDYAFARGLLKLPSLQGPAIGAALFGPVSIDRLQRLLYWYSLADQYVPAGLRPRPSAGPPRRRLAGTTVQFPVEHGYPAFWLRAGDVSFTIGGSAAGSYAASVNDLSTAPALVGSPMRFTARRDPAKGAAIALDVAGLLDRTHLTPHDSLAARVGEVPLPGIPLPGLPLHLIPGTARVDLRLTRTGDQLAVRLTTTADHAAWQQDSAGAPPSAMALIVMRALTGIPSIQIVTALDGPIASPRLSINSNVDDVVAAKLKAMAGDEIARAQARANAEVDRIANDRITAARTRVDSLQRAGQQRLADAQARVADERKQLEDQLKALNPLGGALKIPRP